MIEIFIVSFLIALTGALSPGPLLTFTIYKSLKQKRGYLAAIYILLGHATIEFALIIALLAGASLFLRNIIFLTLVGVIGGLLLVIYGILTIRGVLKTDFEKDYPLGGNMIRGYKGNSYVGGILVSLSNPFWTFWWAGAGFSLLAVRFNITLLMPMEILTFFLGHELGDVVWYLPISIFVYFGGKSLNPKIYKYVLIISGIFMIVFGIYHGFDTVFNPSQFENLGA
ncbi:MAG: LysE family transporter [Candidatus Lokiarchaeota archaeon]|nr:LysE family transporter [Candidatus Lokiarchaeota archaeon]